MVDAGQRVRVHYVGKLKDNTVFENTIESGKPIEFVVGSGTMLAGFELAVSNLDPGEECDIRIAAAQAYGARDECLVITLPSANVPDVDKLSPRDYLTISIPQGTANVRVVSLDGDTITIDCNHELAGQDLRFHIQLEEIVKESPLEEEQHAAGCGCGCNRLKEAIDPTHHA